MLLEALGKIGFDYKLAIANAVNFVIIFFLLKKYFFGPIGKSIDERKKKIEEGLAFQKEAEEGLLSARKKEEEMLVEAHKKAKKVMDKAEVKGEEILNHFKKEAEIEKQRIIEEGNLEINRKEKEARAKIQEEASNLIVMGAEKLINEDLSDEIKSNYAKRISEN